MAEYCLDCMNRMDGTNVQPHEVTTDLDLCEGCGEVKECVVCFGGKGFFSGFFDYFKGIFDFGE